MDISTTETKKKRNWNKIQFSLSSSTPLSSFHPYLFPPCPVCASVLSSPVRSAVFPTRRTTSSLLSLSNSIQAEKPKKKKENNKYPLAAGLENNETVRVWTRNLSEMSLRASCFFRELRNRIEEASVYLKKNKIVIAREKKKEVWHTL